MPALHPIQRRLAAEELVRRRRADEDQRYAASQRRGRIDPNPHQIDAVIFALRRIPEGGCILADEVGLGKTIEAGLVIAQLLAEGARRVLLLVPKSLLGQWQDELYTLFGMEAREAGSDAESLAGSGVFLAGRELAGSERGSELIRQSEPFDLCVIDEAHELFANIYKRYDAAGNYRDDAEAAVTAHRVRGFLLDTPVLLLTATPIQNTLTELWGLVQYIEPTGTLLGNLRTFRQVFVAGDDRQLVPGQAHELRRRIDTVLQRTLRRQAQEFLERPFVERRAQLFHYTMSPEERALYDEVSAYLLEPDTFAFPASQRRLLLIGFQRRMASSLPALAASLRKVADRLRAQAAGERLSGRQIALDFVQDLEDEDLEDLLDQDAEPQDSGLQDSEPPLAPGERELGDEDSGTLTPSPSPGGRGEPGTVAGGGGPGVAAELARVEGFIARAESLPRDSKAGALLEATRLVLERGERGEGSGKLVIFTESLTTQEYLDQLLRSEGGLADADVTLFRGHNDQPRAHDALARWQAEVGDALPEEQRPSRPLALRLALVHEFKTRSKVFIATEAGAKGLNLQFCDALVNYDLPWNPQRIEQRIGRCHRYGQERSVTVINFLARDNETEQLTFDILSRKLDLFGEVLDASDHVLHSPRTVAPEPLAGALGVDFESSLRRIYESARSIADVAEDLRELRDTMDARRTDYENTLARTAEIIETRFDESVRQVFRRLSDGVPASLERFDRDLEHLVSAYLDAIGASCVRREESAAADRRTLLEIEPLAALPMGYGDGATVVIGHSRDLEDADPLHLGHPLVRAAVDEARAATSTPFTLRITLPDDTPDELARRRSQRARLRLVRIGYSGFEPFDHLRVVVLFEGDGEALSEDAARLLLELEPRDVLPFAPPVEVDDADLDDAVEEIVFLDQAEVAETEQTRFEAMLEQIERYLDDQILVLRRERIGVAEQLERARQSRDAALGPDARGRAEQILQRREAELETLDAEIQRLEARDDESYQTQRRRAHDRRYSTPEIERLFDADLELV